MSVGVSEFRSARIAKRIGRGARLGDSPLTASSRRRLRPIACLQLHYWLAFPTEKHSIWMSSIK
jgi:hypothetical protein